VAEEKTAALLSTVTLVAVSAILTGVGVYDTLARVAGAGTLVPVTGFANAVVSPALDTRAEGLVVGIGAKIFTVAGPVLLYAVLAGAVYGGLYFAVGEVMAWLGF
jgi:stage V sporulation protein AC